MGMNQLSSKRTGGGDNKTIVGVCTARVPPVTRHRLRVEGKGGGEEGWTTVSILNGVAVSVTG